ncbi:type II toxin-antitoxin system VapC family toxin [Kaistia hirudinis]|uniref:type II toxin-antitoxin system VapC family toxin n=1 Tax=Kaistia hirudinis TaxID=1293440 RepID=UPI001AEE0951|nr:type II toxin-antitoxin system VapC family toxin [Kaistia hirudinis]
MIFVDASALVAMIVGEPDAAVLADALDGSAAAFTSPIAIFEAVLGVRRVRSSTLAEAQSDVDSVLDAAGIEVVPIHPTTAKGALEAFALYGKGRGHPAQLNMGDCFAYAMAKSRGAALLFKGDDFVHTDIRSAVASS